MLQHCIELAAERNSKKLFVPKSEIMFHFTGQRRSISRMISSAQQIASAIALIVACQTVLILTLAGIGAVYTMLGGLRGNAKANIAQNIIAGSALIALCGYISYHH